MASVSRHKTSAVIQRNFMKSRYLLSIVVGLALGFALSFACLPLMNICDNSPSILFEPFSFQLAFHSNTSSLSLHNTADSMRILNRQARSVADVTLVDYRSNDYEPRIHPLHHATVKSNNSNSTHNKTRGITKNVQPQNGATLVRPRYLADELGIREKVLVAVLTETSRINTYALFLNQTLKDHVNRISFFISDDVQRFPDGMHVIAINDKRAYLKPFYVIKYLAEKMINLYDWFFLVPDNTYIRGFKLNEFLNHISIGQDLYMGQAFDDIHAVYCFFGSGIILSGSILRKIYVDIDWCTKNAYSQDVTDNIGRCILKTVKIPCTNSASNLKFNAYVNYRFEFETDIDRLSKTADFNRTLTVHPIQDMTTMLKLQKYFNEVEIEEAKQDIKTYEAAIERLSCYAPEGCGNVPWPVGVPPPFKPPTRFDVLRWDYFNETHIYLKTDNNVVDRLSDDDYQDVHEIIDYAVEQLQKKYSTRLKYKKLLNGYRQFDPTRGTHYIVDISLTDESGTEYIKRAELMRPLGLVEVIPMPFVTETTKLFLILPIHSDERATAIHFLHHANKTLFERETRDKFELLLTHIVTTKEQYSQTQMWFKSLRSVVDTLIERHKQLTVTYHTLLLPSANIPLYAQPIYILDHFQTRLRTTALIFLTNPYVDIDSDFLNRCRLNVIQDIQLFFPIAFYQYHPSIVARTRNVTDNSTIDLHKSVGWFNSYAYDHIALHMSDYVNLKKLILNHNISMATANLFDLFAQLTDMHILRAPDQSLRVHYRPVQCNMNVQLNPTEHTRCLMQQEKGLASRSQLAMIIIEDEQNRTAKAYNNKT